jgi:hypothetical protein
MGRGHDAHVHRHLLFSTDGPQHARLDHTKEANLHFGPGFSELVEKQRSTMRELEQTFAALIRSRKRTTLVAQQLALKGAFRQRAAVLREKRACAALTRRVNRTRHEFLAATSLAQDEHRHACERSAAADQTGSRLHPCA